VKILVFDSDIQNYHLLRGILEDYDMRLDVIGPFTTVEQGRDYLLQHRDVDIIISDVMLGGDLVFDTLDMVSSYVPIIFVTSHKEYALQAFDYYSLSYILKPVGEELFVKAISKAVRLRKIMPMLTPAGSWTKDESSQERIVVKTFNGERVIHITAIRYIVSEQKNTYIKLLDGSSYRVDKTLEEMASQLDASRFMRVNRKYILPIEQISGTERKENGKLRIMLKGTDFPNIIISRTRKSEVCEWLRER
jgi:DNA-binding LytR/AlgR family response regulator